MFLLQRIGVSVCALAAVLALSAPARAQKLVTPGTRGFLRYQANQRFLEREAAPVPAPYPANYTWYLPPEVPTDRTYCWYAPPGEYDVILQATPAQPRLVTVVGPDGTKRTFRLEGPIVIRRPLVVRRR